MLTPLQTVEIDDSLHANLQALRDALIDVAAALVTILIGLLSFVHSLVRLVFAGLALVLWSLALIVQALYCFQGWLVSHAASSLHQQRR